LASERCTNALPSNCWDLLDHQRERSEEEPIVIDENWGKKAGKVGPTQSLQKMAQPLLGEEPSEKGKESERRINSYSEG